MTLGGLGVLAALPLFSSLVVPKSSLNHSLSEELKV